MDRSIAAVVPIVAVLLPAASSVCAQDADPRLLASSCAACHGPAGRSPGAIPSLNGRAEAAIGEALRAFRDGKRPATVMVRIARGYSDAEIDALARTIATDWR